MINKKKSSQVKVDWMTDISPNRSKLIGCLTWESLDRLKMTGCLTSDKLKQVKVTGCLTKRNPRGVNPRC